MGNGKNALTSNKPLYKLEHLLPVLFQPGSWDATLPAHHKILRF